MRKLIIPIAAIVLLGAGAALSQTTEAPAQLPAEPVYTTSPEDLVADPFPAGPNAALVKAVCTDCHRASIILDIKYTREDAERYYKNMVGEDISTDQAKKIIHYLTTTLGV